MMLIVYNSFDKYCNGLKQALYLITLWPTGLWMHFCLVRKQTINLSRTNWHVYTHDYFA